MVRPGLKIGSAIVLPLLSGGGTCLHTATLAVSKQLLPVLDKPMICYYPRPSRSRTSRTSLPFLHCSTRLYSIRTVNPKIRFYQASASEMVGKVQAIPQDESTPLCPRSAYGVAKLHVHWITLNYPESYGIFGTNSLGHKEQLAQIDFSLPENVENLEIHAIVNEKSNLSVFRYEMCAK